MTPYYEQYEFISPESTFALVREELNSYFYSGALDDTLFPLWTAKVLKKLTRGALPIRTAFVLVEGRQGNLPEDFKYPREVWALENYKKALPLPGNTYAQITAKRIDTPDFKCNPCSVCEHPDVVQAVYKISSQTIYEFSKTHLLRPGKVIDTRFPVYGSDSTDIYEVEDGVIKTNLEAATLYINYYAEEYDEYGFQLVPDDVHIIEAIEAFLKFKCFEMLYNMASDESFNQSRAKKQEYEQAYLEKFIIAQTWMKKETKEKKRRAIIKQRSRFNAYKFK